MTGDLEQAGALYGLLQDGDSMLNLIGPMNVFRGDSLSLLLTVTDDEDERVSLTGKTIQLGIAATVGGELLVSKTVGSGITLADQDAEETEGQATIALSTSDLDRAPGLYWLGVVVSEGDDRQHVIAPREFTIDGAVP